MRACCCDFPDVSRTGWGSHRWRAIQRRVSDVGSSAISGTTLNTINYSECYPFIHIQYVGRCLKPRRALARSSSGPALDRTEAERPSARPCQCCHWLPLLPTVYRSWISLLHPLDFYCVSLSPPPTAECRCAIAAHASIGRIRILTARIVPVARSTPQRPRLIRMLIGWRGKLGLLDVQIVGADPEVLIPLM